MKARGYVALRVELLGWFDDQALGALLLSDRRCLKLVLFHIPAHTAIICFVVVWDNALEILHPLRRGLAGRST